MPEAVIPFSPAGVQTGRMPGHARPSQSIYRDKTRQWTAYALVTPATLLMLMLLIGPVFLVALLSFTDWQLGSPTFSCIGLDNYRQLFSDDVFRQSFINTCIYSVVAVPASIFLGLGAALLIEAGRSLKKFYRAAYFLPVMTCTVAMAITWQFVLHPGVGIAARILPLFGMAGYELLQEQPTALLTLCGIGIWQNLGFNMVLFMAGLSGVPDELYEARGTGRSRQRPGNGSGWSPGPRSPRSLFFVVVITAVRSFQVFDTVHVLTQGGPNNATEVLIYTMYTEAFEFFRTGYASAITVVFLLCVLSFTLIKFAFMEKKVHYK